MQFKYRLKRIGFAAISFGIICAGALIFGNTLGRWVMQDLILSNVGG